MLPGRLSRFAPIAFLFACTVLIAGCGSGPSAPKMAGPVPGPAASDLQGNWLLFGSLPSASLFDPRAQGLTLSINVSGDTLQAVGELRTGCANEAVTGSFGGPRGTFLTTTIAPDGSFTLTTPAPIQTSIFPTLTLTGTAPDSPGGAWTGTYSYSNAPDAICPISASGPFTATALGNVTGTYTGSGKALTNVPNLNSQPLSITASLEQGGVLQGSATMTGPTQFALDGTIEVQGVSCFTKGTISPRLPSLVTGDRISAFFLMDDGSTLNLLAYMAKPDAGTLSVEALAISGGLCSGGLISFGLNSLVLQR